MIITLFMYAFMRTLYNSVDIAATLRRFFAVCYLIIIGNYNYLCSVPCRVCCALIVSGSVFVFALFRVLCSGHHHRRRKLCRLEKFYYIIAALAFQTWTVSGNFVASFSLHI